MRCEAALIHNEIDFLAVSIDIVLLGDRDHMAGVDLLILLNVQNLCAAQRAGFGFAVVIVPHEIALQLRLLMQDFPAGSAIPLAETALTEAQLLSVNRRSSRL